MDALKPWEQMCIGDRVEVTLESALQLLKKQGEVVERDERPKGPALVFVLLDSGDVVMKHETDVRFIQ